MSSEPKANYRESEALTKKLMALKGKGESKTESWQILALKHSFEDGETSTTLTRSNTKQCENNERFSLAELITSLVRLRSLAVAFQARFVTE